MRKETFDINKLLVSSNGSTKIMHPIRKISTSLVRMRMRNQLNKLS